MSSETASANKRIAKNSLFLFGRLLFVLAISVYLTRVVLNVLGVEDFGIYNAVCGFVLMFNVVNVALSNGIQRFYNFESGRKGAGAETTVYRASVLMQVSIALLLVLIIEPIGLWFINHKMVIPPERLGAAVIVFHIAVASLVLDMVQVPYFSAITAHEKFNYYALISLFEALLKLLLIVLVVSHASFDRMIVYAIVLFAVKAIVFLSYFIYAKLSFSTLRFKLEFDRELFRSMSGFVGWNMVEMLAWTTEGQGINMLLNVFFGPLVNAARAVASQVQNAIQYFCLSLMMSFRPQIVNSYAEDNLERTKNLFFSLSKFMFVFFYMLSVPFIMDMDFVLKLWLGENIPQYTVAFTTLFLVSMYPRNFAMAISQVVRYGGFVHIHFFVDCPQSRCSRSVGISYRHRYVGGAFRGQSPCFQDNIPSRYGRVSPQGHPALRPACPCPACGALSADKDSARRTVAFPSCLRAQRGGQRRGVVCFCT